MTVFKKGANIFAKTSQEPLDILESISPAEIASCVPFVKIEKVNRLGVAVKNERPIMFDLLQSPNFGSSEYNFGLDADSFQERGLVSLNSLNVEFQQQYGQQFFRQITLEFTVHQPAAVFDRASTVGWREILTPGNWFTLEYGWTADPTFVKNPLFNGEGFVSQTGQVLKPTQTIMLNVDNYSMSTSANGEVKVTVNALENGDLCMRMMKFSDIFENSIGKKFLGSGDANDAGDDDVKNIERLRGLISALPRKPVKGKGEYFLMGDILDGIVAPMITDAAKLWGYNDVQLLLGNFNKDSGPQSNSYFGGEMAGKGIENFKVPVDIILNKVIQGKFFKKGRSLFLQNLISQLIQIMNGEGPWAKAVGKEQPNVLMKSDTVKTDKGIALILIIHDIKTGSHPFGIPEGANRIALEKQSKKTQFEKLRELGVPILEFARAGSLITDSSFSVVLDQLQRSIFAEAAYKEQKDRVQISTMPDTQSRKGQARNGELVIPVSILEGEIQMYGNFALEVFGRIWIDYFGAKEISGVYSVRGKTDTIEAGSFKSTFKVISEGIDPLNTRRRLTDEELASITDARKKLSDSSSKKKTKQK